SPTTPTTTGTSAGASRPRPSSPRSASPSSTTPTSPTAPAAPPGSTPSPGCPLSPPRGWSAPDEPQTVRHARRPPDRIRLAPPAGAGQREGLPMTEQTPQIPHALHLAMAEWGRHHARPRDIDAETAAIDEHPAQLPQALADLSGPHADPGRRRDDAQPQAECARSMVEHGCQLAGSAMPEQPHTPAPEQPPGVEPIAPDADPLAGQPDATVTDPPDGGGQPEQRDFQSEPRRRRGGRRDQ